MLSIHEWIYAFFSPSSRFHNVIVFSSLVLFLFFVWIKYEYPESLWICWGHSFDICNKAHICFYTRTVQASSPNLNILQFPFIMDNFPCLSVSLHLLCNIASSHLKGCMLFKFRLQNICVRASEIRENFTLATTINMANWFTQIPHKTTRYPTKLIMSHQWSWLTTIGIKHRTHLPFLVHFQIVT